MAASTYYGNFILDAKTSGTISLHTQDPTLAGTVGEVVGGSYSRQSATFGAASNKQSTNTNTLTFSTMPAVTLTHWVQWDGSNNPIWVSPLASPVVVQAGQNFTLPPGSLTHTVS